MARLIVHPEKIGDIPSLLKICPFGAMVEKDGRVEITAACRMCRMCIRKGPKGAVEYVEDEPSPTVDKSLWRGVAVYVDHVEGDIHPVTLELLGKARELADKIRQPVYALFAGEDILAKSRELLHYGVDRVYAYDDPSLRRFSMEPYAAAFADFIRRVKPAVVLVGATTVGRQLAPRVAARFHTGLTADCTMLDIRENTDLVQVRPAFGGNIMAQILTPRTRPQMATVRYQVMNAPRRSETESGEVVPCRIDGEKPVSHVEVLDVVPREKETGIDSADVLVVAGRGVRKPEDLALLRQLADALGGEVACTRPLVEAGWMDSKRQIGLSGRTVRPRLIVTCGVSGSVQFVAGMNHAGQIVAINRDPKADIFKVANYGLVGDLYQIVPDLIGRIRTAGRAEA